MAEIGLVGRVESRDFLRASTGGRRPGGRRAGRPGCREDCAPGRGRCRPARAGRTRGRGDGAASRGGPPVRRAGGAALGSGAGTIRVRRPCGRAGPDAGRSPASAAGGAAPGRGAGRRSGPDRRRRRAMDRRQLAVRPRLRGQQDLREPGRDGRRRSRRGGPAWLRQSPRRAAPPPRHPPVPTGPAAHRSRPGRLEDDGHRDRVVGQPAGPRRARPGGGVRECHRDRHVAAPARAARAGLRGRAARPARRDPDAPGPGRSRRRRHGLLECRQRSTRRAGRSRARRTLRAAQGGRQPDPLAAPARPGGGVRRGDDRRTPPRPPRARRPAGPGAGPQGLAPLVCRPRTGRGRRRRPGGRRRPRAGVGRLPRGLPRDAACGGAVARPAGAVPQAA